MKPETDVETEAKIIANILESLEPLFKEAAEDGLWFYYQGIAGLMIFSPKELKAKHAEGKMIWGPSNWRLVDPSKDLRNLKQSAIRAKKEVKKFEARIEESLK